MSAEAVNRFLGRVSGDPSLQTKVKSAIADRGEAAAFELVEMATELGFTFTATELGEHLAKHPGELELSEAELETVAGGLLMARRKDDASLVVKRRKKEDPDS